MNGVSYLTKEKVESTFRGVISSFARNGLLDPDLVMRTGIVVRPSEVCIDMDSEEHSFYCDFGQYILYGDFVTKMTISTIMFERSREFLSSLLEKAEVDISEEQLNDLTLVCVLGHEYAHAIASWWVFEAIDDPRYEIKEEVQEVIEGWVAETIFELCPDKKLEEIERMGQARDCDFDIWESAEERWAEGFGWVAMKYFWPKNLSVDKFNLLTNKARESDDSFLASEIDKGLSLAAVEYGYYSMLSEEQIKAVLGLIEVWEELENVDN